MTNIEKIEQQVIGKEEPWSDQNCVDGCPMFKDGCTGNPCAIKKLSHWLFMEAA